MKPGLEMNSYSTIEVLMASIKICILSIAVQAAAISMFFPINGLAMERLDLKQVTDADKVYFGSRLTLEQIEKLQYIANHGYDLSALPCDNIVPINEALVFLKEVTPVFRKASNSNEISAYARKYSSSLARVFTITSKAFAEVLPRYRKICTDGKQNRQDAQLRPN
jgi:hypothetical protein